MAKITTGTTFGLTREETCICRAIFDGMPTDEILKLYYKTRDINGNVDTTKMAAARRKLSALKRKPQFQECYAALVREVAFDGFGKAQRRLDSQIDDAQGWLANKASNDYISHFGPYVMGDSSNEVTVRIEGLPTLGTPDIDETPDEE